jgi:hypothetical protein
MLSKNTRKVLVILVALVLGLTITLISDCFSKTTSSPKNIYYDSSNVLYDGPLVAVTLSKQRGFPFASKTKIVNKYTNEEWPASTFHIIAIPDSSIAVQLPAVVSTGSNSFARILQTWQFYADIFIWTIVWLLLGYSIKSVRTKFR